MIGYVFKVDNKIRFILFFCIKNMVKSDIFKCDL